MVIHREFSTPNADYIFQGRTHVTTNNILIDVDGLMLEGGSISYKRTKDSELETYYSHPQMSTNVFHHLAKGKPFYIVDPGERKEGNPIFTESFATLPPLAGMAAISNSYFWFPLGIMVSAAYIQTMMFTLNQEIKKDTEGTIDTNARFRRGTDGLGIIIQGPLIAGREAIMARKLEEYVAPKLAEELGIKPIIGLLLGSGHTGIEWHLKHPIIRNITIRNYELLNTKPYKQFNPEQVDSVLEISMKNNDLDFTIHKTGLFPRAPDA